MNVEHEFYQFKYHGTSIIDPDDWYRYEARAAAHLERYKRIYTVSSPDENAEAMADMNFNTAEGSVVERKLLILYLNTGTSQAPVWSVVGKRVEDSSMEYDWSEETKQDILGNTYTTMKKPKITQTFDPCELDSGDKAQVKIWNQAVRDQDVAAMSNNDLLVVHAYTGTAEGGAFAERYPSSAVRPTGLGGSANVGMPIEVTFGGERQTGTAKVTDGAVAFTAA